MKDRNVAKELGVCGADLDKEGMEREPTPRVTESKFVLTLEHFSSLFFDSLAELQDSGNGTRSIELPPSPEDEGFFGVGA